MSALSKRQQLRNEKQLQELVQTVPGNNICADCHARNPAWASWSLGVFLCMRCAAIHRKLGTHISKVKSLSMDSWSNEQVDNMRKVGNVVSNQIYNPGNKRPPVPVDADEADSAMERFIRQKYINNVAKSSGNPTSPRSDEGVPPPLPPKNSSKFGLRSAASLFPLSTRSKKDPKPAPSLDTRRPSSHGSAGKAAKVFGASVNYDDGDDMERKLARLRDMGFHDSQRNAIVLKGVNGNLERAIESLVRLGEGDGQSLPPPPPPRDNSLRPTRSLTPLNSNAGASTAGLSVPKSGQDQPTSPSSASTNPFDMMTSSSPAPLQTAHSTGSLQNNNPYNQSLNPFGAPTQQVDHFAQAFQQLDISGTQQTQPLFPNRTGGLTPQSPNPPGSHAQPMAPSAPSSPQVHQHVNFQSMTYPQPAPLQQHPTGYNPFLSNPASPAQQQPMQQNLIINTQQPQPGLANNPFARSPTRVVSPTGLGQIPEQSQTTFQSSSPAQPQAAGNNPFLTSPVQTQTPTQMGQQAYAQQMYFHPQRQDKASIMALYGSSPSAAQQPMSPQSAQPLSTPSIPENQAAQAQPMTQPAQAPAQPQRSMTQPLPQTNTNNPFMNSAATTAGGGPFSTARSRESVNLGMDMAWNNGRHSPDAFASLSARHG